MNVIIIIIITIGSLEESNNVPLLSRGDNEQDKGESVIVLRGSIIMVIVH